MELNVLNSILAFLLLALFPHEYNKLHERASTHLNYVSFVKLKAVYNGNFHNEIEVLESNIEDYSNIQDLFKTEDGEMTFVSLSQTESLLDKNTIPNCRLSVLNSAINTFLFNLYKLKQQKCILKKLELKYNEGSCSTLGSVLYRLKGCGKIKKEVTKLMNLIQELKERTKRLESFILSCFLASIKISWKNRIDQDFVLSERNAKKCTHRELFSNWEEMQLLKKTYQLFKSFTSSSLRSESSRCLIRSCIRLCSSRRSCKQIAFEKFLKIQKKIEIKITNLELELGYCASYLIINEILNESTEIKSNNKFTSLICSIGELI